jgi:hypothetical protein
MWKGHNKNAICWVFYCVNDGKDDGGNPQVMKCLLGYIIFLHAPSPNTKERKALTTYYKTYERFCSRTPCQTDRRTDVVNLYIRPPSLSMSLSLSQKAQDFVSLSLSLSLCKQSLTCTALSPSLRPPFSGTSVVAKPWFF